LILKLNLNSTHTLNQLIFKILLARINFIQSIHSKSYFVTGEPNTRYHLGRQCINETEDCVAFILNCISFTFTYYYTIVILYINLEMLPRMVEDAFKAEYLAFVKGSF